MTSLRRFLQRVRPARSARGRIHTLADRVRRRGAISNPEPHSSATPRNRYLDPRTEDREVGDDTHSLRGSTRIRVEYAPVRNGDPDPGEVVWTWIPYVEDPSKGKDRPAIIIGRSGNELVGVPLTTKPRHRETNVKVGSGQWDSRGRVSFACIDRVMVIDPDAVRREGAVLARDHFDAVVRSVDDRYDIIRVDDAASPH